MQATLLEPVVHVPGDVDVVLHVRVGAPEYPVTHVPATLTLPALAAAHVALFSATVTAGHAIAAMRVGRGLSGQSTTWTGALFHA